MVFSWLRRFDTSAILLIVLWCGTCTVGEAQAKGNGKRLLAYYTPNYGEPPMYTMNLIPYTHLTHLFYAFVYIDRAGHLQPGALFPHKELVKNAHAANIKIMVSVGGAGKPGYKAAGDM